MSDRLEVDTNALAVLGASLSSLADTLSQASSDAAGLGEALGDDDLAGQVRGFAVSWDDRRRVLVDEIRTLGSNCVTAASSFTDTDHQLADALCSADPGQG